MALPIGMLEWEPAVTGAKRARISAISSDGAADTVNQSNYHIYRWNAFDSINLSGTVWQVCTFWNSALNLVVGVRNTAHGAWTLYVMDGGGGRSTIVRTTADNHNNCNVGLDSAGYIHISYDQHAVPLKYQKSTLPISSFAGAFGGTISMLGTNESSVTYPTFFRDPLGTLFFIFRDGASGGGNLHLYKYSTGSGTWSAAGGTTAGKVIDGLNSSPNQSPYWNGRPEFTSDWDGAGTGFMYLAWIWRATSDTQTVHDMSIVRWNGVSTWTQTNGSAQTMPVLLSNCEIASSTVAQNLSFTSFNTIVLDSNKRPHMFITGEDASDSNFSKLWHIYWNGSAWTTAAIAGGSGFTFGLNGPCAVIDSDDTIRVVVCHVTGIGNGNGISAYVSAGSNWSSWSLESLSVENTYVAEGTTLDTQTNVAGNYDRYQWKQNGVFRMMVPLTGYWQATTDTFSNWAGYIQATADAPSGTVTNPTLRIVVDSTNTQWWAAVASDGKDVRISDGSGQQFPVDLAEWNYAGQFALITFMYYGDLTTAPTVRVYAGNAGATAPAASDTFGQYAAYHPDCWGYWPSGGGNDRTSYANHFTMTGSPSATAATGVMGETTYDYNGSTQYGLTSTKVVNTAMTMMINVRSTSNTLSQVCFSDANGATTGDYRCVQARGSDAGDPVAATSRIGGNPANDSTLVGYVINTWFHLGGRFSSGASSEGSRTVYKDGTAGTPNTTTIGIPTATRVGIAVLGRSALDAKFVGKLANAWLFDTDIGDAKVNYNAQQNNQAAFWNGWTWTSQGSTSGPFPFFMDNGLAGGMLSLGM